MGDRVWLTLATFAFAAGVYALMLKGWRGRQRRQGDLPPPPPVPDAPGDVVVGATSGLFVGTVFAGDWLDRVAVHRLSDRAAGWLTVHTRGVLVDRDGAGDLWLPYADLVDAEPGDALAGKVVGREGMLVLTWRLGSRELQSGFRADDHSAHRRLADAVRAHLPVPAPEENL
ncbi:MAG: integral rane protein [Frankiales bacterium]|nr:integral rane protein [Frankiales bacterium]